jgi:cytochrome c nitrite reductase small subunit
MHRGIALAIGIPLGLVLGLGGYTFVYARGGSYLTDDPAACGNCHIMREQVDGWAKSSHHAVAVCNDCHTPPGVVGKYSTKALNGFWHSFYFTFGGFPEPIHITSRNREVTEQACRKCHDDIVDGIMGPPPIVIGRMMGTTKAHDGGLGQAPSAVGEPFGCIRCHGSVGHLK